MFLRHFKVLFFFLTILSLANCTGNNETIRPDDILGAQKMASVLSEIHISESMVDKKKLPADSASILLGQQYAYILDKHKIDRMKFLKSFDYYLAHPDKMESIYTNILESLSEKEALLRKQSIKK